MYIYIFLTDANHWKLSLKAVPTFENQEIQSGEETAVPDQNLQNPALGTALIEENKVEELESVQKKNKDSEIITVTESDGSDDE